jgi:hypothetical protein
MKDEKFTDQDNENMMRFAACFALMLNHLQAINGKINMSIKYRMQNLRSQAELFLKQMQKGMSDKQKEQLDIYCLYCNEIVSEALKAKDKSEFLLMVKSYNSKKDETIIN